MTAISRTEIDIFKALVEARLGLHFDDGKLDFLADVVRKRIQDLGCEDFKSYLGHLTSPVTTRRELRSVAEELTTPETYFFRNVDHFRALTEVVLPDRARAQLGARHLRILSAGCASGEEPYSLAMALREHLPDSASWKLTIRGIDLNMAMLEKARRGRYSSWSFRQTPKELQDRYFTQDGRDFILDPAIRKMVVLEERNLTDDDPDLWQPGSYDVVFCRNVMMYFAPELMARVVARIAGALVPGGFLFLGHAETLRGISQPFHVMHTHDTFYYRRWETSDNDGQGIPRVAMTAPPTGPSIAPGWEGADSWLAAIQHASDRIQTLAGGSAMAAPPIRAGALPAVQAPARAPAADLNRALELLRQERFSQALDVIDQLSAESKRDPDVQLLHAVLVTNCGDLQKAQASCAELLKRDEFNAGAHYLMALCEERVGRRDMVEKHDQKAIYLDSGFAMPHLHLGLVARRAADLGTARRELSAALILLAREDATRLTLFGGGFSRDALMDLCRTELRACGAPS